ncbi:MAG: hypothetical protein ACKO85_05250, partial [Isosphaeraceae bacterium]
PVLRCMVLALIAGLLASITSWVAGELVYGRFIPPLIATGGFPTIDETTAAERARRNGVTTEAAVTVAIQGAALGLALGLAGGIIAGKGRSALGSGLAGMLVAGFVPGAVSVGLTPIFLEYYNPDKDMLLMALTIHGCVAMSEGAAAGLALWLGLKRARSRNQAGLLVSAIKGGLLGAGLAMLIFQIAGMVVFPLSQTTLPISISKISRLTSHSLVALLAAIGSARAAVEFQKIRHNPEG